MKDIHKYNMKPKHRYKSIPTNITHKETQNTQIITQTGKYKQSDNKNQLYTHMKDMSIHIYVYL